MFLSLSQTSPVNFLVDTGAHFRSKQGSRVSTHLDIYIYISATSSAVCVKFEPTSQWITAPVWKECVFWNVEVNSAAGVSMSVGLENANVTDSSRQLDQI